MTGSESRHHCQCLGLMGVRLAVRISVSSITRPRWECHRVAILGSEAVAILVQRVEPDRRRSEGRTR
jgi:hypothetical protein